MQKLYYGGSIITMEEGNENAEVILIEDGIIKYVGSMDAATQIADDAERIDLEGHTLIPGFIDGHGHFSQEAIQLRTLSLEEATSFSEIVSMLSEYISVNNLTKEDVIVATGYDHTMLAEKQHPTKYILNQASSEIPIYASHLTNHMGCVNDAALRFCRIDESTTDPLGGLIGRAEGSREPNGYLEETGIFLVWDKFFSEIKKDMSSALALAQENYLKNGFTTVQDGAADIEIFERLKAFSSEKLLKLDLILYPLVANKSREMKDNPDYVRRYKNHLKLGGYKLFLDGSPQAKTAWLTRPYENSGDNCGYPRYEDGEVLEYLKDAVNNDEQILAHCNGDAASDQFINIYKKAVEESENSNRNNLRPVMVHCQTVRDDQLDEMLKLGMIPTIFVGHTYYWGDVHTQNLGVARASRISPSKSALDRGILFNFHQDTPVTKPDMLHTIWCAVNRISRNGKIIGAEQCLDVYDALKATTINAAYMYFEENIKGSLKAGKQADLVILDRSPLDVPKIEIKDIKVLETIKEGHTVWKAKQSV